jgi:hypothetical protein
MLKTKFLNQLYYIVGSTSLQNRDDIIIGKNWIGYIKFFCSTA